MSEYIIETDDALYAINLPYLREEIVRCRDCVKCEESKAYSTWFCHRFSMCDSAGFPVEPDGYCKWGERRGE